MALATNALTNVATMEAVLGLASGSADARLQRVINQASAIAEAFAGRVFYRNTAISEKHPGQNTPIIVLEQPPINSITSVTYLTQSAEDSSSYEIHDANVGEVYRVSGTWGGVDVLFGDASRTVYSGQGRMVWTFAYDGGWYTPKQDDDSGSVTRTLPYDIEQAVIAIAVALYRAEGRDPTLTGERLMEAQQTYATAMGSSGGSWLEANVPSAAMILRRYKRGLFG